MSEITKQDLNEVTHELKDYIDAKFIDHEKTEKAMFTPIIAEVAGHKVTLYGGEGRGGVVKDMNDFKQSSKMLQWIAGLGFGGMSLSWLAKIFK